MNIGEKVAYLKGLAEGLELDVTSKNGRLISGILDALGDVAEAVSELESNADALEGRMDTIEDYATDIDKDLGEVEETIIRHPHHHHHQMPPDFYYKHKHNNHGSCDCCEDCDEDLEDLEGLDDDTDSTMVKIKCPMCNDSLYIETSALLDNDIIMCPNCDKPLSVIEEKSCGGSCCCGEECGDGDECADDCQDRDTDGKESEEEKNTAEE